MHLIRFDHVSKIYNPGENEVRALDDVSCTIDRGEFVALWGKSGSGKSTAMNIMGCLDVPTLGRYYLDGQDVTELDEKELAKTRNLRIGFVFQGFNLIPSLNAYENVELPLVYRGYGKDRRHDLTIRALNRVGLGNRLQHLPSELSGGQQQRVAIARAISASPPIIMADEPTGNLDSASGREMMAMLEALHKEGHTIILITHDSSLAELAYRIIRLHDGRIVADDRIKEELLR
jgi:putative ABC transport system ATP-binding protein